VSLADDPEVLERVGVAAGRVRRFGEAIAQGHSFGVEAGEHRELWTPEFQRQALPIYTSVFPWEYLMNLAASFLERSDDMREMAVPGDAAQAWFCVDSYLKSTAEAITDAAPENAYLPNEPDPIRPVTPPVMPFARLARITHIDGAKALSEAGRQVELLCGQDDQCPLTEDEIIWLKRLRAGDRVIDIAQDHGYAERTLYRALSDLWDRLTVDNRTDAIALCAEKGWLNE
jgi:DNA-binding CsgD family transcriptional regulator